MAILMGGQNAGDLGRVSYFHRSTLQLVKGAATGSKAKY